MKKVVFVLAFVAIATISFAAVNSLNSNPVAVENFDEKPKKDKKKADAKKTEEKKACTKTETKSSCSKTQQSSCCKKAKEKKD